MTTAPSTIVAMAVLAGAGLLPVLALVGLRWITAPLLPLAGAVVAALAATCYLATGGSFMGWFVGLAALGWAIVGGYWLVRTDRRPWHRQTPPAVGTDGWYRAAGAVGAVAVLGACAWCLRGLSTPTVGFDARAVWLLRGGWFLQSHHQLMINMRIPDLGIGQSAYPPLVSAVTATAWSVTGDHSERLGVTVMAMINTCALATAAFGIVELGRRSTRSLAQSVSSRPLSEGQVPDRNRRGVSAATRPTAPLIIGVVGAVLLVFIAFGITEPFVTNGYADPIWSLAAVGAVVFGLQLGGDRSNAGTTGILLLVAGMSKDEGFATAITIIALVALRGFVTIPAGERRRRGWRPVVIGLVELGAIAAWPVLMRAIHARGATTVSAPPRDIGHRADVVYHSMGPYLHVLILAVPLAVLGGLVLSRVRRASGVANDLWGWAALLGGLVAVVGAYTTESGSIQVWLLGTVHRVTEFPVLCSWWIVAAWAVVAGGVPTAGRPRLEARRGLGQAPGADDDGADRSVRQPSVVGVE
jgi:hypothetical protein